MLVCLVCILATSCVGMNNVKRQCSYPDSNNIGKKRKQILSLVQKIRRKDRSRGITLNYFHKAKAKQYPIHCGWILLRSILFLL